MSGKQSPAAPIFEALLDYEKDLPHGQEADVNRFVTNNDWLVNTDYINNLFLYGTGMMRTKIPGLYRTNVYGLLKNYVAVRTAHVSLSSVADAIQITQDRSRLRAFYLTGPSRQHTVKIISQDSAYARGTRHEIEMRQQLAKLKAIRFPRIENVRESENFLLLAEELILGRRFNGRFDRRLFSDCVLPQLTEMYRAYGVRYLPLSGQLPPDTDMKIDDALGGQAGADRLREAMARVIEGDLEAAVSLCHGDLLPSNLAVAGGTVTFLDWEMAHEDVIAFDLLRIAFKYPKLDYMMAAIRETMVRQFTERGCGFEDLLAAYVARKVALNPLRASEYLACWQRHVPEFGRARTV